MNAVSLVTQTCYHPRLTSEGNCSRHYFWLHVNLLAQSDGPGWAPDLRTASPTLVGDPW